MPPKLSHTDQIAYIHNLLGDNPTVQARLEWSAYCQTCEKEIPELAGEKNWPGRKNLAVDVLPRHESEARCPTCKGEVNANPKIRKMFVSK